MSKSFMYSEVTTERLLILRFLGSRVSPNVLAHPKADNPKGCPAAGTNDPPTLPEGGGGGGCEAGCDGCALF